MEFNTNWFNQLSMSGIYDMNNRVKQNRNMRPSNRAKFQGSNRDLIYAKAKKEKRSSFKKFSDFQVKKAIDNIRKEAKSKRLRELILLFIFVVVFAAFFIYSLIPA